MDRKDFISTRPVRRSVAKAVEAPEKPARAARKPRAPRAPKMPDQRVAQLQGGLAAHAKRLADMARVAGCVLGKSKLTEALHEEADLAKHLHDVAVTL